MKTCTRCEQAKPIEFFSSVGKDKAYRSSHCRACVIDQQRQRRQTPEGAAKRNAWAKANQRIAKLKRHGVAEELIPSLLLEQDTGSCHACERSTEIVGRLHVDHDHATNEYRGLLCKPCNTSLGLCEDSPDRLAALAAYLTPIPADLELMR
jgi:uncharacterized protein CbrC (UPF0167 family)